MEKYHGSIMEMEKPMHIELVMLFQGFSRKIREILLQSLMGGWFTIVCLKYIMTKE